MFNSNVTHAKKKALLAYKEKILDELKYYEKSIDDFRANHKNTSFYDDHNDSSDSEDDFANAIDLCPTIVQLKRQESMMKTCLHATQELTSLIVLQSEVNVLVEDPKLEGEKPVTEAGTWREVTAECRIDLVPFSIMFFMHTPDRKFGAPSYRGLRVIPVKNTHEMELANSVLHTLKLPSDAIEVLKSYAAGYRSRRTTLARLANKYANVLFMEPHAEGGFVLKCADLLEVSWRLENKWSPVAPFHHKMKFDLEYMDESYIKIITQAHKQLLDPAIQTDERTLLLAKIVSTCLEARGPVDPESDLESKTTERDNENDTEKRDSEVMAPPKSLPKKTKQKNKDGVLNAGQKRSMDDENDVTEAKKIKNDIPNDVTKKSVADSGNVRKSKLNDVVNEGGKKRKTNDVGEKNVASSKNVKETGNTEVASENTNSKNTEEISSKTKSKNKNVKDAGNGEERMANKPRTGNTKPQNVKDKEVTSANTNPNEIVNVENMSSNTKSKTKNINEPGNTDAKAKNVKDAKTTEEINNKTKPKIKNVKETENKENNAKNKSTKDSATAEGHTKSKTKIVKDTVATQNNNGNIKPKEKKAKDTENNIQEKGSAKIKNKIVKEPSNIGKDKNSNTNTKKTATKEDGIDDDNIREKENRATTKSIEKIKPKQTNTVNAKNGKNTAAIKNIEKVNKKDAGRPKSKTAEKSSNVANTKNIESNPKPSKKTSPTITKAKTTVDPINSKENNVANAINDENTKKALENIVKNKNKASEIANKTSVKNINVKQTMNSKITPEVQTVTEKNATTTKNKDKISQITNTVSEKIVKDKLTTNTAKTSVAEKVISSNIIARKSKETINSITNNKKTKELTKPMKIHQIASHRNSLKMQNPQKALKASNTKLFSSDNTEKENGGQKNSKIPQKKISTITESVSKKNFLRISPRKLSTKFKSSSQETFKQKIMRTTNIPRLLKKPGPKTSQ